MIKFLNPNLSQTWVVVGKRQNVHRFLYKIRSNKIVQTNNFNFNKHELYLIFFLQSYLVLLFEDVGQLCVNLLCFFWDLHFAVMNQDEVIVFVTRGRRHLQVQHREGQLQLPSSSHHPETACIFDEKKHYQSHHHGLIWLGFLQCPPIQWHKWNHATESVSCLKMAPVPQNIACNYWSIKKTKKLKIKKHLISEYVIFLKLSVIEVYQQTVLFLWLHWQMLKSNLTYSTAKTLTRKKNLNSDNFTHARGRHFTKGCKSNYNIYLLIQSKFYTNSFSLSHYVLFKLSHDKTIE